MNLQEQTNFKAKKLVLLLAFAFSWAIVSYGQNAQVGCFALDLDGTDDRVEINAAPICPASGSAFTASAWFNLDNAPVDEPILAFVNSLNANDIGTFVIRADAGGNNLRVFGYNSNGSLNTFVHVAVSMAPGTWHHVAAIYNGTFLTVYYDGNVVGAPLLPNFPTVCTTDATLIGRRSIEPVPYDAFFDGRIDDVALWSTAISGNDIIALAAKNTTVENITGTLVAYYDFEDGAGSTATDQTGANHGTLEGNMTNNDWVFDNTNNGLSCVTLVSIPLSENCNDVVNANQILNNNSTVSNPDCYEVTIFEEDGVTPLNPPNEVNGSHIGLELPLMIVFSPTGEIVCPNSSIIVTDGIDPVLNCVVNQVDYYCGESTDPLGNDLPIVDDCDLATLTHDDGNPVPQDCQSGLFEYFTRTWIATDESGNVGTCAQTINVKRIGADNIEIPGSVNIECTGPNTDTSPSGLAGYPTGPGGVDASIFEDACDLNISHTDVLFPANCTGHQVIIRNWVIVDLCGNTNMGDQIIRVVDNIPPVLTCPDPIPVETDLNSCFATVTLVAPTAVEDCSSVAYSYSSSAGTVNGNVIEDLPTGTHTVTAIGTDACGNESLPCSYTITVEDTQAPTLPCDDNKDIWLGANGATVPWTVWSPLILENCALDYVQVRRLNMNHCDGDDSSLFGEDVPIYCCDVNNTVTIEIQAADLAGNINTCTVSVNIHDNISPEVGTCPSDKSIACNNIEIDLENTYDGITEDSDGIPDDPAPGPLAYKVDDFDFNNSTPIGTPVFIGYYNTASDNCELTVYIYDDGILNTCGYSVDANDNPAPYLRWYVAMDATGLTDACDQKIMVTDPTPFDPTDPNQLDWPNDLLFGWACGDVEPDNLPFGFDKPIINQVEGCDVITVLGHHDGTLIAPPNPATANYCYAIPRTWYVQNECTSEIYSHLQFIKTIDFEGPTFVYTDVVSAGFGEQATVVVMDIDDNCTAAEDVVVTYDIDQNYNPVAGFEIDITGTGPDASGPAGGTKYPDVGTYLVRFTLTDNCNQSSECFVEVLITNGPSSAIISGGIQNEEGAEVEYVSVEAEGNGIIEQEMTGNAGTYEFNLPLGNNYTIDPERDDNILNGVSTYDLVLISKHILQFELIQSPYKIIAADVNHSGSVSTLDLVALRRVVLFIDDEFPNNTSWRFVDADFVFPTSSDPFATSFPEVYTINGLTADEVANFVGIKVGDVNCSAAPNDLISGDDRNADGDLVFTLKDQNLTAGETYQFDFEAQDFDEVQGFQFTLTYNKEAIVFNEVNSGDLNNISDANFGLRKLNEGVITASWNADSEAQSLENGKVLFSFSFTAMEDGQLSDLISLNSRFTKAEAYDNRGLLDLSLAFVDESGAIATEQFELYQNQPNPFKDETVIGFYLPESGKATFKVFDISGRVISLVEGDYSKGYNEISINRSELQSSGVLYYQLESAEHIASKKMVLID